MQETVYLIQNTGSKHLKIGYTGSAVQKRLAQLQTGSSEKLKVITTIPGNTRVERGLHKRFAKYRLEGEWFMNKGEIRRHFFFISLGRKVKKFLIQAGVVVVASVLFYCLFLHGVYK